MGLSGSVPFHGKVYGGGYESGEEKQGADSGKTRDHQNRWNRYRQIQKQSAFYK